MDNALTTVERQDHLHNEEIIANGLKAFYEVGSALMRIRDSKSYRETHDTFEAYCKDRWDITRPDAYRKIESAKVREDLSPIGDILPTNEGQSRPFYDLTTEDRQEVWKRVIDSGDKITAKRIKDEVKDYIDDEDDEPTEQTNSNPDAVSGDLLTQRQYEIGLEFVKSANREMSKLYHPDKGGSTEDMQAVNFIKTTFNNFLNRNKPE